jgi:aminoglycoside/choline kinase family phosphotransferase
MKVKDNNPGILDFQDAVIGPVTYDLVSLLEIVIFNGMKSLLTTWQMISVNNIIKSTQQITLNNNGKGGLI